jgi:hypothetical protein
MHLRRARHLLRLGDALDCGFDAILRGSYARC